MKVLDPTEKEKGSLCWMGRPANARKKGATMCMISKEGEELDEKKIVLRKTAFLFWAKKKNENWPLPLTKGEVATDPSPKKGSIISWGGEKKRDLVQALCTDGERG